MASGTVAIKFRLDGADQFHILELDAKSAGDALKGIQDNARTLNSELVNLASKSQLMEGLSAVVQQLNGVFQDLSAAYAQQTIAETRLAQAMRNTMDASNEEIESIKQLCSEQQKLGVIGDEVQLAASQELATYLTMSDNLKTLIPVMNDMVAQQYGLGASAESATQIASMLGKVMNGQTEALSRYGYKFDEAQKYILKYGDESERAAVLAQVVSESVGGMNAQLARTPVGRMQQLKNTIGDVRENLGKAIQSLVPAMTLLSSVTNVIAGWTRLKTAMDALAKSALVVKVQSLGLAVASRVQAMAQNLATTSTWAAVFGTRALTAAVTALWAALTLGISLIITGIIALFNNLSGSANDAADAIEEVDEAQQAYNNAVGEARGEIATEIVELEHLIKSHGDETKKIQELNAAYGESFGYHNTAKEWYDILINKSKEYCKMLGYEAKLKAASEAYSKALVEQDEANDAVTSFNGWVQSNDNVNPEYQKLIDNRAAAEKKVAEKEKFFNEAKAGYAQASSDFNDSIKEEIKPIEEMSYSELGTAIQNKKSALGNISGVKGKEDEAKSLKKDLEGMEARYKKLGKENGLGKDTAGSSSTKNKFAGDKLISEAKNYNELSNNVKYYEKQIEKADASDKEQLSNLASGYADAKKKLDDFNKTKEKALMEASKPEEIKSVGDIRSLDQVNKAIDYQQKLRNNASADQLKNINAEIQRLNNLKTAFEDSSHTDLQKEQISSYQQLEDEISFYTRRMKTASQEELAEIQQKILKLQEWKKEWDDAIEKLSEPADISVLNTIEDLDEAIAHYSSRLKKADGDELIRIQQIIIALQKKKAAKESLVSNESKISEMQTETGNINSLSGQSLKVRLELIGLDGIAQKIRDIQKMLDDPASNMTDKQRESLKSLQAEYANYYKTLLKSDKGLIQSWSTIRGITGSIESMTEAIKGHGNAWKKISRIIDSTISLYQSISQIVQIVKLLTGVTKAQTDAKAMEGAQDIATGTQAVTGAAMEVSASQSAAAAKSAETTTNVKAAASGLMAAHSSIPFVGWAIGAALVVAMLALMAGLPKFANGGIAYGPTLGLFGEYSGASNNPEVIAPLDRLKTLIGGSENGSGRVTFRIEGRTLVGVLEKESHYRSRR